MTYKTVVRTVNMNGTDYLSIEFPEEMLSDIDWVDGEVLEWNIDNETDQIFIKRTKVVVNGYTADQSGDS